MLLSSCGILPGDVIVSINGKPVKASTDVFEALSSSSELRVVFLRGQKRLSGTVIAEEVDS
jgi:S1-C subfamily serine protease